MNTPGLRPEGANGTANGAVATIGIEAARIRNLALDVPKKTAKVDRMVDRIGMAAAAILDEIKNLNAEPKAATADDFYGKDWEAEANDVGDLLSLAAERLAAGDTNRADVLFQSAEQLPVSSGQPVALRVVRAVIPLIHDIRHGARESTERSVGAVAAALAELMSEALAATQPK